MRDICMLRTSPLSGAIENLKVYKILLCGAIEYMELPVNEWQFSFGDQYTEI